MNYKIKVTFSKGNNSICISCFFSYLYIFTFQVARALIELFGEMIFVHGFVHGDPHPGNILVSPQGRGRFSLGALFASEHDIFCLSIFIIL